MSYYRARYYDPAVGRFLGEDPINFGGGANFYVYVWNLPTALVDPLGLLGLQPASPQQLANLMSLFPGATLSIDGAHHPYLIVVLPCTTVQSILENNSFATANNTPYLSNWQRNMLFGHSGDHPTGTQVRQRPGLSPSLNLHFELHNSAEQCPYKTCTINAIHNDPHNPLTQPPAHLWLDLVPYHLGIGEFK